MKSEQSVRKAGENVDDTQWKDTVQLHKDEEEFFPGTRVSQTVDLCVCVCVWGGGGGGGEGLIDGVGCSCTES